MMIIPILQNVYNLPVTTCTNQHSMVTREKAGIFKPKTFLVHSTPHSVSEALANENWRKAMLEEYHALQKNKTWTLVHLPPNRNAISCKWVFRVKENADGTVQQYKARLVAKGFSQQEGFNYNETFSSVVKPTSVRVVLTLALIYNWPVRQFG